MTQLTSAYDPKSEEAIANTAAMTALVEDLKAKLAAEGLFAPERKKPLGAKGAFSFGATVRRRGKRKGIF